MPQPVIIIQFVGEFWRLDLTHKNHCMNYADMLLKSLVCLY